MDASGPWRIASLSPSRRDDYLAFFDHERGRAFADNPAWASCYCHFFHAAPVLDWASLDGDANRTAIDARIATGEMEGFLAYDEVGNVVGWLNAQPRHKLPHCFARLEIPPSPLDVPLHEAAAVLCFVIDPALRRRGIARLLLDHALANFEERGIRVVDAFPSERGDSASAQFRGPPALLTAAGFEPIARQGRIVTMRKRLR
jgi:ribosomal protein S18 acetylase RimI-like enzyme